MQALAADERSDAWVEGQDVVCPGDVAEEGRGAAFENGEVVGCCSGRG